MSKKPSSSRPAASVFGALGPDDAYFGNRVQAAARDAQQRWPLLGGLAPSAAEETPELSEGDKARWQPQPPLVPSKPAIARPSLGKKLESGLGRLAQQTRVDDKLASQRTRVTRPVDEERYVPDVPPAQRAVRAAPTQPADLAPAPSAPVRARSAPRVERAEPTRAEVPVAPRARASAPAPVAAPKDDQSLGGVFRRLSSQAAPASPDASRKSILGRLGKR